MGYYDNGDFAPMIGTVEIHSDKYQYIITGKQVMYNYDYSIKRTLKSHNYTVAKDKQWPASVDVPSPYMTFLTASSMFNWPTYIHTNTILAYCWMDTLLSSIIMMFPIFSVTRLYSFVTSSPLFFWVGSTSSLCWYVVIFRG